jgi:hypothetical protein
MWLVRDSDRTPTTNNTHSKLCDTSWKTHLQDANYILTSTRSSKNDNYLVKFHEIELD